MALPPQRPHRGDADVGSDELWQQSRELAERFLIAYGNNTMLAYKRDLRFFFDWCKQVGVAPLACTRADLELYTRWMTSARGLAPVTVARRISSLSGLFRRAVDEELLERSPASSVRRPRVRTSLRRSGLTGQELVALLAAARKHSPRAHLLVCLLALNGLRVSEALGLAVRARGTERGRPVIRVHRKGGVQAVAPLAPETAQAWDTYVGDRRAGLVFLTRSGRAWTRSGAAGLLTRLVAAALPDRAGEISPHSLRRSFVTLSLDAGCALRDVQDAASHASADQTRKYDLARGAVDRHPTFTLASYLEAETQTQVPQLSLQAGDPEAGSVSGQR